MSWYLFLALSLAGGIGAAARLLVDGAIRAATGPRLPVGTVVVNVVGSLLLGLLTGLVVAGVLPEQWRLIAGTGFLGGFTTFSTASFETVRLVQQRRGIAAVLNGVGVALLATAAAGLGLVLGALA